jgi:hypothetical protein
MFSSISRLSPPCIAITTNEHTVSSGECSVRFLGFHLHALPLQQMNTHYPVGNVSSIHGPFWTKIDYVLRVVTVTLSARFVRY